MESQQFVVIPYQQSSLKVLINGSSLFFGGRHTLIVVQCHEYAT